MAAEPARTSSGDSRAARKELTRIERRLEKITSEESRLHDAMATNATDHEKVLSLDAELRALSDERGELEDRWLELSDDA